MKTSIILILLLVGTGAIAQGRRIERESPPEPPPAVTQETEITVTVTGLAQSQCETLATIFGWTATVPDDKGGTKANPVTACDYYAGHLEKLTRELLINSGVQAKQKTEGDAERTKLEDKITTKKKLSTQGGKN